MSSREDFPVSEGDPFDLLESGFLAGAGRYTLKARIGVGTHSEVWQALDHRLGEDVALKFLSAEVISKAGVMAEIRRRAQKSRSLSHPNIVRVYDVFHSGEEPAFIAMEFVEGRNLAELSLERADQVFSWDYLKPLIEQVCAALAYAHGEGMVHGGITPGNLILNSRGRLKLRDFGLHPLVIENGPLAFPASALPYLSPRQLDGAAAEAADDIYGLGATLYELLCGSPLFRSGDIPHQIRSVQPDSPAERMLETGVRNDIPPGICALFMACVAKEPDRRPASAAAVAEWIAIGKPKVDAAEEPISLMPPEVPASAKSAPVPAATLAQWDDDELENSEPEGGSRGKGFWTKALAAGASVLLVALGFFWGARHRTAEAPVEKEAIPPNASEQASPVDAHPEVPSGPMIFAGSGPDFRYRYNPRATFALDTNAVNQGVALMHESAANQNCSFIYTTNENSGSVTYKVQAAPGYMIQNLGLVQSAALFTKGGVRGEYSVDGGTSFQTFFSTPPFDERQGGYYKPVNLLSLDAPSILLRYTIQRQGGLDYNVQFLRDADDAPAALEINGTVVSGGARVVSARTRANEVSATPDRSQGLNSISNDDGKFKIVAQGGRECWLIDRQPNHHLYMNIDDSIRASFGAACTI
jgi:serine/threonine protein kinase